MFRYIGFSWNPADESAAHEVTRLEQILSERRGPWVAAFSAPGLSLHCADLRPPSLSYHPIGSHSGVLVGTLFKRGESTSSVEAHRTLGSASEESTVLRTGPSHLTKHYWGRYVAFLYDSAAHRLSVLRDPTGALPCFRTRRRGVTLFFSNATDCAALGMLPSSIDLHYLRAYVGCQSVQSHSTGICGVSEVLAGEAITLDDTRIVREELCWRPSDFAMGATIDDFSLAVRELRQMTEACVWAWASCHSDIVHLLSGGLDSSIVLHCLRTAPSQPTITGLNYSIRDDVDSDERRFARLAARASGVGLIEVQHDPHQTHLPDILRVSRAVKPWPYLYYVTHSPAEARLARETRATAIFQAAGGDQVFFQGPLRFAAVDHAYCHGLRRDLFRIAGQLARAQGLSIWSVLRVALRDGWIRPSWTPGHEIGRCNSSLVTQDVLAEGREREDIVHPWLHHLDRLPPGKRWHIYTMLIAHQFYDPLAPEAASEPILPLASQPLMELCLRIPTPLLLNRGVDRAVARAAFANVLPGEIIRRRTKGIIDGYLARLFHDHRAFLQDMLLDGFLVQERLLDRAKVEAVLSHEKTSPGASAIELLTPHLSTEVWARQAGSAPCSAA